MVVDNSPISVSVLYTTYDTDSQFFDIARDIRVECNQEEITADVVDKAYETVFDGEIEVEGLPKQQEEICRSIFKRMQGGRTDEELNYVGVDTRSMAVGDIIAVNGSHYLIDHWGYTPVEQLDKQE